jgi:hypothetical protein
MNPNPSLMTQLTNTMSQGQSPMNVQTPGSPMYQPSLITPAPAPTPDRSPEAAMHLGALHRYYEKNGMQKPSQLTSAPTAQPGGSQVTLPVQDTNPQQPGVQIPVSEAELIVKALTKRLEHHSKAGEKVLNALMPDFSQSPVAGQSAQLK